ncbi:MAG: hypothetical protein IJ418_09185 [Clostridia bacterium]|nr:hypothetical protein [Clostridia bacterium]
MASKIAPIALMLMKNGESRRREDDGGDRGGYQTRNEMQPMDYPHRMNYIPPYGEPDMRRRNYPTGEYDGGMESRRRNYPRSGYDGDMIEDRRMGFGEQPMDNYDHEMRRRRRPDGTFMHHGGDYDSEPIRFGGMVAMDTPWEKGRRHGGEMTREMAEKWVEGMESADPQKPRGGKWTLEQVKPLAQKMGFAEGQKLYEFWAVMNAIYSDYYEVSKKYNLHNNPEYFAEMAKAWLYDKDAVENKATVYYECIVK